MKMYNSVNILSYESNNHGKMKRDEQIERRKYFFRRSFSDVMDESKNKDKMVICNKSLASKCQDG